MIARKGDAGTLGGMFVAVLLASAVFDARALNPEVRIANAPLVSACGNTSAMTTGMALSGKRVSDGTFLFQAGFDTATWSGSLTKRALRPNDDGTVTIAAAAEWDAGRVLTGMDGGVAYPQPQARRIYTAKADDDRLSTTIEFTWDKLSDAQKAVLNASPLNGRNDKLGEKRLEYLRGQRALELGRPGGIFRARDRVLGDIVNGNPVHVGPPALNVQGPGYREFHEAGKSRVPAVYVGANDGMLHAFNAADGKELFAYIPNALMRNLNQLTRPDYVHRPYADGMLTVTEAQVAQTWKTVLVSGMGGGAQGVVALDVTDPADFAGGMGAIWEFTDADDADMGNVMTAPAIAKFRAKAKNGTVEYKYFAVVPSGLNNYKEDGSGKFNRDAAAALFLLSLDKSLAAKWQLGVNYYKFRIPSKDADLQNGLASPALVSDGSGAVRHAYAGDLQGNLWRFDFTETSLSPKAQVARTLLFTAKDAAGTRQPITVQPKVVFAPSGGYVVMFGTGKFIEDTDTAAGRFRTQSFYGIQDALQAENATVGHHQLAQRMLDRHSNAFEIRGDAFSYGSGDQHKRGWYFDFPDSEKTGERAASNLLLDTGRLIFNSLIPGADPCVSGGGRTYMLNALDGLPAGGNVTAYLSQVGMLRSPVVMDASLEVSERNAIGRRTVKKKSTVLNAGTGGPNGTAPAPIEHGPGEIVVPAGRFSWREILNWQELRDALGRK